ncbi:MAG: hypothetical protein AAF539_08125 [Planctomycetota bacterium]
MNRAIPAWLTITVLIVAVFLVLVFSAGRWSRASRASQNALQDLRDVRQLTDEIKRIGDQPRIASLDIEPPDRITRRVQAAAAEADIADDSILRVDPQSVIRIGQTRYQIRPTLIVIDDVSLSEITHFAKALADEKNGMTVRDLTITSRAPVRGRTQAVNAAGERWDARLTLTQMIYSPISDSPSVQRTDSIALRP